MATSARDSPASPRACLLSFGQNQQSPTSHFSARRRIPEATTEGHAAHTARNLLRSLTSETRSKTHPRTSWVFWRVDRHGSLPPLGDQFQFDASRLRPAAARRIPRYEARKLQVLRNHLGIQPPLHLATVPGRTA